jgi:hypothetical protein
MEGDEKRERLQRFRIKTVRGEPYVVGERKLTPVVRVVSWGKARATIGTGMVTGWGTGFVQITPLAVLEETDEGEVATAITDTTGTAVRGLVLAAAVVTLFFATLRWLVRRQREMTAELAPFEKRG